VAARLKILNGLRTSIPVGNEILPVFVDHVGPDGTEISDATRAKLLDEDNHLLIAQCLYGLLPSAFGESSVDEAISLAMTLPLKKANKKLINAYLDGVVFGKVYWIEKAVADGDPYRIRSSSWDNTPEQRGQKQQVVDGLLLWMAEFKATADAAPEWVLQRPSLTHDEVSLLAYWIGSEVQTDSVWAKIAEGLVRRLPFSSRTAERCR